MRAIFLFFIAFVTLYSCDDRDEYVSPFIETVTLTKGNMSAYTNNPTQHGEVITKKADWDAFRTNYWQSGYANPDANNIDFDKEVVVLVFDKPRTTGGFYCDITSIKKQENDVLVTTKYSGADDGTTMATRPCHIVKMAKPDKPITFQ